MDSSKEGFDFQVVSILGEQVSFVPTKLSPLETAIVEFDEYYKPEGISDQDFRILKNTMKFLFSTKQKPLGDSKETTRNAYPPCQTNEKELVLKSLLHRKRILQQQMFDLGLIMYPEQLKKKINELRNEGKLDEMLRRKQPLPIQGKETLLGDTHFQHWLALDNFIQDYDTQALCIDVLDISHKDLTLDLTDENIKELLQQFVFFMLQGAHPLPEYKKTDPTAPAFVSRLKRNPMGDKFPTYLTTYKSKKLPISPILAKILESTDLDPRSMRDEFKRLIEEEKTKILVVIQRIIPPTDPFWATVRDKKDIRQIVEALWVSLQDAQSVILGLQREIENLKNQIKQCDKEKALLTIQKRRLDIRIRNLSAELVIAQDESLAKTRRIEELEEEKRELEARLRANQEALDAAKGKDEIIAQLKRDKGILQGQLDEANRKLLDETAKVGRLEKDIRDCKEELARVKSELEAERGKDAVIARLTAEKQGLADELAALKLRVADLQKKADEADAAKSALAALQIEFAALTEKKTRCDEELLATKAALEKEKGKDEVITRLTAEKQGLADELAALKLRMADLQKKAEEVEAAKSALAALQMEFAALMEKKTRCDEELQATKAALEKERGKDEVIARLTAEKEGLAAEKQGLADELAALKLRMAGLQKKADEGDAAKASLAALQLEFNDLSGKKTRCDEELEATKAALEKEKGKDAKIAALEKTKGELEARIGALEAELGPLRGKGEELETLQREFDEARAGFDRRIAELDQKRRECEESLAAKESEYDTLLFENQDLKSEIFRQRTRIEELKELQAAAEKNIEDLRKQHLAAIGVEKSKVAASEAARTAALKAAEDATTKLASTTTELASTKASLKTATDLVKTKDTLIAELRKAIEENEAALLAAREALGKCEEERKRLSSEAVAASDKMNRLQNQIAQIQDNMEGLQSQKDLVDSDNQAKARQIAELQAQIDALRVQITDLTTAVRKCEEEKKVLEASASGAATSSSELAGKLRVAEEERAAAQARVAELEATIQALRRKLEAETARANAAEEDARNKNKTIKDQEETIRYFEGDIDAKQGELDTLGKRAEDAEKEVGSLKKELAATLLDKDGEIAAVRAGLEENFQQQLADQQSQFESTLRDQKKQIEDSLGASAASQLKQTRDEYEAALQQQKENYEKVYAVIQRIAEWIDSGEDTGVEEAADVKEDTPQAGPLRTIVTKLGDVHSAASGSSSPTARKSMDSTINLCYIVFLVAFLWQTNFPPQALEAEARAASSGSAAAGDGEEVSDWEALHSPSKVVGGIPRQKLLQSILPTVFNGGAKPSKETWASSTSAPAAYAFRQGLYRDLEMRSAGATTKHEFAGKLYNETMIIRRLLHLFNKISRAMEGPSADRSVLGLDELDSVFLDQLVAKFTTIITDYKDVYRTPTFHLESAFPTMASETLAMNQPLMRKDILKQYLVKTGAGYRIVTKADTEEPPGLLNYATLFFSFLVVMRDYLNHIEGTVYAQCPLPAILRRTKSRK